MSGTMPEAWKVCSDANNGELPKSVSSATRFGDEGKDSGISVGSSDSLRLEILPRESMLACEGVQTDVDASMSSVTVLGAVTAGLLSSVGEFIEDADVGIS